MFPMVSQETRLRNSKGRKTHVSGELSGESARSSDTQNTQGRVIKHASYSYAGLRLDLASQSTCGITKVRHCCTDVINYCSMTYYIPI